MTSCRGPAKTGIMHFIAASCKTILAVFEQARMNRRISVELNRLLWRRDEKKNNKTHLSS